VQRELNVSEAEVSIALVSDREMAKWNEQYRHKKVAPTFVISGGKLAPDCPHEELSLLRKQRGSNVSFLGDVAIAPETAQRYARKTAGHLSRSCGY